jgi:hypothetical protein
MYTWQDIKFKMFNRTDRKARILSTIMDQNNSSVQDNKGTCKDA